MSDNNQMDNTGNVKDNGANSDANNNANNANFFGKIIELITGINDEDRKKNKKLKEVNKDLLQSKYKFYNFKKDQILPAFPAYIFEVYKNCLILKRFFDIKVHSGTIKQILFESIITNKQKELKIKLEKENVEELIRTTNDVKKAFEEIKANLSNFIKSFNPDSIKTINFTYNQIVDLSNITNFDWYFLLRKFDSSLMEANFNYKPNYEILEGKYIYEELVSLNDYIQSIDLNTDWKTVGEYLKGVSDDQGLGNILKKLISMLKSIKKDDYLTKMIILISKDPDFSPKQFSSKYKIVQDYIQSYQMEVQNNVQNYVKEIAKEKINKLLLEIFRSTVIIRLKNYSQKLNDILLAKNFASGFKYVEPLNYMKAFLLDICKGEIKPRIDYLIIKGTWDTNTHSSEYSSMLLEFNKLSDKIIDLDNRCGEDDLYGKEIKRLSGLLKHDPKSRIMLKKALTKIDYDVAQIIFEGINLFKEAGNSIKILLEDYNSKIPSMLINFHKIKWDFSTDIKTELSEIFYKKLFNIIVLLKSFVKETDVAKPED